MDEMRLELHSPQICAWHSKRETKDLLIRAGQYKQNCRDLKIPLSLSHNKPRAMPSESQQITSKADCSGKKAGGFMGLLACGGMTVSMSKSPLLNEASW